MRNPIKTCGFYVESEIIGMSISKKTLKNPAATTLKIKQYDTNPTRKHHSRIYQEIEIFRGVDNPEPPKSSSRSSRVAVNGRH